MKNPINPIRMALVTAALLSCAINSYGASSLGASFLGRNGASYLAPTDSAGPAAQAHWNNVDSGSTFTGTTAPLADQAGNFTSVQLIYQCNDSWNSDGPSATPNDKLALGIIKQNGTTVTNVYFTFTNLPAGTYDVYVGTSMNGDAVPINTQIGATTYYTTEEHQFSGTWIQASSTSAAARDVGNYVKFTGVTAAADGTIKITATRADLTVSDGLGISFVQAIAASGQTFPTNTAAPGLSDTNSPADISAAVGGTATFTVVPDGPWAIQWQKNGANIAGATLPTYTTPILAAGDNGAKYKAIVSNNIGTITSREATLTVLSPVFSPGFLTIKFYENIAGVAVSDLLADTNFIAGTATSTTYIPTFSTPNAHGNNYGAEVIGYIIPPTNGNYVFYIRSDDASQLYLSADASIPNVRSGTLVPIAEETGCCDPFHPIGDPETSAPITLVGGQKYGVTALLKEGGGGDYLQVAWSSDVDPPSPGTLTPMPGNYLATDAIPLGSVAFSQQPSDQSKVVGQTATFTVGVTTTPAGTPFGVTWQKNGTDIAGANSLSYTTPNLVIGDSGTKYGAKVLLPGNISSNSVQATLTVGADNIPPVALGATAFPGTTKVGVAFDEALDPVTAGTAANYQVNGAAVTSAVVRTNVANEISNEKNLVQLTVPTALGASGTFTVTVNGVKDANGNVITTPQTITGKILDLTLTDIGSQGADIGAPDPQLPSTVTTWGPGAFDVLTTGSNDYYNNADGMNFLWVAKTNSFDVKVRVLSVSPINNWSAGAIEVREGPVTTNGGGWELARHYFVKTDYGGPGKIQVLDNSGTGADTYEYNGRLAKGDPTVREGGNGGQGGSRGWGGTAGTTAAPVPYPNAWIRIARVKNGTSDHLLGYSSSDGVTWVQGQDVDLNDDNHAGFLDDNGVAAGPMPDVLYVGMGSVSHTGIANNNPENTGTSTGPYQEFWYSLLNQPYSAYVIYRDFGDVVSAVTPTLSYVVNPNGTVTLTFTGTLYSSDTANGTYAAVAGAASPLLVDPKTTGKSAQFYQAHSP